MVEFLARDYIPVPIRRIYLEVISGQIQPKGSRVHRKSRLIACPFVEKVDPFDDRPILDPFETQDLESL